LARRRALHTAVNAVWSYEAPHVAASAIREYLAFYPDRVDAIEIDSEGSGPQHKHT